MTMMTLASLAMQGGNMLMNGGGRETLEQIPTKSGKQTGFADKLIDMLNKMSSSQGGYSGAENYYNKFLGPDKAQAYQDFSEPYLQQFNQKILPDIAERFGARGALSSSGFAQALGGAGADLQSQLAQLFSSLQSQAANANYGQFNQLSSQGLNFDPFAYYQQPGGGGSGSGFAQGFNPQSLMALMQMGKGGGGSTVPGASSTLPNFQFGGGGGVGPGTSGNYGLPTFLGR